MWVNDTPRRPGEQQQSKGHDSPWCIAGVLCKQHQDLCKLAFQSDPVYEYNRKARTAAAASVTQSYGGAWHAVQGDTAWQLCCRFWRLCLALGQPAALRSHYLSTHQQQQQWQQACTHRVGGAACVVLSPQHPVAALEAAHISSAAILLYAHPASCKPSLCVAMLRLV